MKTAELTGALLDYWVARADGAGVDIAKMKDGDPWCAIEMVPSAIQPFPACVLGSKIGRGNIPYVSQWFYPSTSWSQGGPIIARERMKVEPLNDGAWTTAARNGAHEVVGAIGPTALVSAMRAYVISKFGDEVPDDAAIQAAAQGGEHA